MARWFFALAVAWLVLALLSAFCALAHGPENWIAEEDLSNPVTGKWCCGPKDCQVVPSSAVREVPGGYVIQATPDAPVEFVPENQVMPVAPDGQYHRCGSPYDIRCFFTPPREF